MNLRSIDDAWNLLGRCPRFAKANLGVLTSDRPDQWHVTNDFRPNWRLRQAGRSHNTMALVDISVQNKLLQATTNPANRTDGTTGTRSVPRSSAQSEVIPFQIRFTNGFD